MKLVLLGAPGSGKGTLSELLIKKYNFHHISTGDLFRKIVEENSELSSEIKKFMSLGKLVPDELTNKLARREIEKLENCNIILDGYPRNVEQAEFLNNFITIDMAIYLDVNEDIIVKRLTGRRICDKCGKIYNIYFSDIKQENICNECGGILIQRKDDEPQTIADRLKVYYKYTYPLVDYYKKQDKLFEINGEIGKEEIEKQFDKFYNKLLNKK